MKELITLYHGTTEDVAKNGQDIFGKTAHGFSTKLVVDIHDVPDEFLDRAFLPSKELGVGNNGYLYRISRDWLKEVKNI